MSIKLMTAVWDLNLADSEKLVLLALADSANDDGKCWPSMPKIARKCSKSERTVQGVIKTLIGKGLLTRREKPGRGVIYYVYPAGDAPTPAGVAPPQPLRPRSVVTPAAAAPTPAAAAGKPSKNLLPPDKANALSPPTGGRAKRAMPVEGKERRRGTRIDAGWMAPPIEELPAQARDLVRRWPAGAYELTALTFHNHFLAESRAQGSKLDWPKTWVNWVVREHPTVLRNVRAGFDYTASAPGKAGDWTPDQQVAALERQAEFFERIGRAEEAAEIRRSVSVIVCRRRSASG